VDVKVVDLKDRPVPGAQVEASNGRKTTTDENGIATIRFGSLGVHSIAVVSENHMPANVVVTLPTDRGKTITARLTNQIKISGFTFASAQLYPMLFSYLFSTYGYSPELNPYHEGEWTQWAISTTEEEEAVTFKKAFLRRLENGQEWWQVQIVKGGEEEENSRYTAEILFSEDRSSIRRFREKIGDGEIQEKPVTEGWYTAPARLTEESKQGALSERKVSVSVPKGDFSADLLTFGIVSGTSLKLWSVPQVPGGVVKYENLSEDETIYRAALVDFGRDAQTLLESY
jgi:hypothetical protein